MKILKYILNLMNEAPQKTKSKFVSIKEASQLTGICQQTLRVMADQKKIGCYKTPTGFRKFNTDSISKMLDFVNDDVQIQSKQQQEQEQDLLRKNFIYTRVSSKKQLDDLSRQVEFLRSKYDTGSDSFILLQDIGSGINFKRKGLQTILDACLQNVIGTVIVAHRDRLSRFAFDLIESIVTKAGGKVTVVNNQHHETSEQELAEDLLSIVHAYSCRQMGKRKYRSEKENETSHHEICEIENPSIGQSEINLEQMDVHL